MAVKSETQARELSSQPSRTLNSIFEEAKAQFDRGEGISSEQFWREVEEDGVNGNSGKKQAVRAGRSRS